MLTGSLLFGSLSLGSILAGITNIGAGVLSDIKSINVNYAKQIATLMAKRSGKIDSQNNKDNDVDTLKDESAKPKELDNKANDIENDQRKNSDNTRKSTVGILPKIGKLGSQLANKFKFFALRDLAKKLYNPDFQFKQELVEKVRLILKKWELRK